MVRSKKNVRRARLPNKAEKARAEGEAFQLSAEVHALALAIAGGRQLSGRQLERLRATAAAWREHDASRETLAAVHAAGELDAAREWLKLHCPDFDALPDSRKRSVTSPAVRRLRKARGPALRVVCPPLIDWAAEQIAANVEHDPVLSKIPKARWTAAIVAWRGRWRNGVGGDVRSRRYDRDAVLFTLISPAIGDTARQTRPKNWGDNFERALKKLGFERA